MDEQSKKITDSHGDYYAVNPAGHLCKVPKAHPLKEAAGWRLATQEDIDLAHEFKRHVEREDGHEFRGGLHPSEAPIAEALTEMATEEPDITLE